MRASRYAITRWSDALPPEPKVHVLAARRDPDPKLRERVGNKAFNLMRLAAHGMPVPEGFVLDALLCAEVIAGKLGVHALDRLLDPAIRALEGVVGLGLGDARRPLLVSVRSGAAASMPGMLETVLDVGITEDALGGMIALSGSPRLVWDSYRRLIENYAVTVKNAPPDAFEHARADTLRRAGASRLEELDTLELRALCRRLGDVYSEVVGTAFPQDARSQLAEAVAAVFRSWNSPRALIYRKLHRLDGLRGTAVTVQRMVFGNAGSRSGSGVGFTRDPATGEPRFYADFAWNAQGEDVVSGRCPVAPLADLALAEPALHAELLDYGAKIERLFCDAQDIEFTIEEGRLFLLQTRSAKRTPWAALRIAVDLVKEGLIKPEAALERLRGLDARSLVQRRVQADAQPLARGLGASVGAVSGEIVLTSEAAEAAAKAGRAVILVRTDIATDDVGGLAAAAGVLTRRGGRTSHAAVVARQMDKVCVVGCEALEVDVLAGTCSIAGRVLAPGSILTLDGESGAVFEGRVTIVEERPTRCLRQLRAWRQAARVREARLRSNS